MNPIDTETVRCTGRWRPHRVMVSRSRFGRKEPRYILQVEWTAVRRPLSVFFPSYHGDKDQVVSRVDTWWADFTELDQFELGRQMERNGGQMPTLEPAA